MVGLKPQSCANHVGSLSNCAKDCGLVPNQSWIILKILVVTIDVLQRDDLLYTCLTHRVSVTVSGRSGLHVLSGEVSLEKWVVVYSNGHASGDPYRFTNRSGILRCRHCQHNAYLTVGTNVIERSHTPLMV